MKPTSEQIIEWSKEAGLAGLSQESDMTYLMRLVDRIFAAGQASAAQGVEPVATKQETQQFDCFHVSFEDSKKLKSLPVGTKLYTAPLTAAAIEAQVKEECMKACGKEEVQVVINSPEELAYNNGVSDCASAIRALPPMFSAWEDSNAKDAERYRWLCKNGLVSAIPSEVTGWAFKSDADSSIDAAILAVLEVK